MNSWRLTAARARRNFAISEWSAEICPFNAMRLLTLSASGVGRRRGRRDLVGMNVVKLLA